MAGWCNRAAGSGVRMYGQCGGRNWDGTQCCAVGSRIAKRRLVPQCRQSGEQHGRQVDAWQAPSLETTLRSLPDP
jgi:hypothetical protein